MSDKEDETKTDNELLEAALTCARRGWYVMPAWSTNGPVCECGNPDCRSQGKHPASQLVPHGLQDATTDEATIRAWWAQYPTANVGVVLGPSGLLALDVDVYKDDDKKLIALMKEYGDLPDSLEQNSGSGEGTHIFYRDPGVPIAGDIGGITLRAKAYCIVAPSRHKSGGRYSWDSDPGTTPIAHLPPAWVEALSKRLDPSTIESTGAPAEEDEPAWLREIPQERRIALAKMHVAAESPEVLGKSENGKMFNVARRVIRGFAIRDGAAAYRILEEYNNRCVPPYSEENLASRARNAYGRAHAPPWGESLMAESLARRSQTEPTAPRPTEDAYKAHWKAFVAEHVRGDGEDRHKAELIKKLFGDSLKEEPINDPEEVLFAMNLLVEHGPPGAEASQHAAFLSGFVEMDGDRATGEQLLQACQAVIDLHKEVGAEPRDDAELMLRLQSTEKGPKNCGDNIEMILRWSSEIKGTIRYNTLFNAIEVTGGRFAKVAVNDLPVAIKNWMSKNWKLQASTSEIAEQLLAMARQYHPYDPLGSYLNSLVWDKKPRLDTWLEDYAHASTTDVDGSDITSYVRKVSARWMIAAAARACDPGCKVDTVLVLEGTQGAKKSTALRILGGAWFTGSPIVMGNKDSMMLAAARWICELAELASLVKSDVESQKAFLSAESDDFRPPYGRVIEQFKRRCVFAGTVNPAKDGAVNYLIDDTGDRRWWPVRVLARVDEEKLRADRDQLWAEAVWRYRNSSMNPHLAHPRCPGERWWFEPDEEAEANDVALRRHGESAWASIIARWVERQGASHASVLGVSAPSMVAEWKLETIAAGALEMKPGEVEHQVKKIAAACREAGLQNVRVTRKGKKEMVWKRGPIAAPEQTQAN